MLIYVFFNIFILLFENKLKYVINIMIIENGMIFVIIFIMLLL